MLGGGGGRFASALHPLLIMWHFFFLNGGGFLHADALWLLGAVGVLLNAALYCSSGIVVIDRIVIIKYFDAFLMAEALYSI